MTETDVIRHWQKRAAESLHVAELSHQSRHYAHALFNCHLAMEKALKARFMEEKKKEAPPTHDLLLLARQLQHEWTEQEKEELGYLTQYAVASRYDDPLWAEHEATEENSRRWLDTTRSFLSYLQP